MNMNESKNILTQINHKDGLTVPEGYFDDFATKMVNALPHRDEAESPDTIILPTPNLWTRIRPYVYMAAMFAGIWCMLKMFSLMGAPDADLSIDKNQVLTEALSDDSFVYDYIINDVNARELMDEIYDDSISVDELLYIEEDTQLPLTEPDGSLAVEVSDN